MRRFDRVVLVLGLGLLTAGCGRDGVGADDYESTVESFTGHLVHNGKPVAFADDKRTVLQLLYEPKAERFGVPIQTDGTFVIGWMPTGKYTAMLEREKAPNGAGRGTSTAPYTIPGGLTIEAGKTDYTVELGKGWKR